VQTWTFRALVLAALSAAALIGAGVGRPAATGSVSPGGADAFGGPLEAHVVVRPIARDVTKPSNVALRRVSCVAGAAGHDCFAAG
jgi:hypothetical protein